MSDIPQRPGPPALGPAEDSLSIPAAPGGRRRAVPVAVMVILMLVSAAAGAGIDSMTHGSSASTTTTTTTDGPDLEQTVRFHHLEGLAEFGDRTATIIVPSSALVLDEDDVQGVLEDLGFSAAVWPRMQETRALDGTLSATGQGCNVTWTYHPDDGLSMVFEITPA